MKARYFAAPLWLCAALCFSPTPAPAQTSYDQTIHDYITASQQNELARAALAQYGILPDRGTGPEVDVRLVFPASQTGLDNIEMTMLEPVSSGAHECMSIAVKTGGTTIESYFHSRKDARPGHMYDVVVSDSMGDKFWVGRIFVSRQHTQKYVISAPMLTPGSPHYTGPGSAPQPKLGVFGQAITPALLRTARVRNVKAHGVVVLALWPGGSAARWGLRAGDVILGINGRLVHSIDDIVRVEQSTAGLRLAVLRRGRIVYFGSQSNGALSNSTHATWNSPQGKALVRSWIVAVPSLGMNVLPVTQQLVDLMPDPSRYADVHGVIIMNVAPQSWASSAGFQSQDVVWAVNGRSFTTVQAFLQLIAEFQDGLQFSLYRNGQNVTLSSQTSSWKPPVIGPGFVPPATPRP